MPKKKRPAAIEEYNAELERTQTQIRQYENRGKMLDRKIAAQTRKERNHRIYFYGGFLDGIVPELKGMTGAKVKDFLYHAIKDAEAQELLRKRAEAGTAQQYHW